MRANKSTLALTISVLLLVLSASAQKIKVIVDQDARGPGTSDQQAILVFLQSEKFDVLGITTVSGDQWVKEETQHVLRLLEISGRTDVPVYQGAEFPLLNSKEESERWEFNWWFDPEAARSVLHAPWKKLTITPIDISVKTRFTPEMKAAISKADTPVTRYLDKYSLPGYMWDEIAGAALIDPSIITGQKQLYMDIDIDHGASYGKTLFWDSKAQVPPYLRLANVQFDIDAEKFYKLYIGLMTRSPHQ